MLVVRAGANTLVFHIARLKFLIKAPKANLKKTGVYTLRLRGLETAGADAFVCVPPDCAIAPRVHGPLPGLRTCNAIHVPARVAPDTGLDTIRMGHGRKAGTSLVQRGAPEREVCVGGREAVPW